MSIAMLSLSPVPQTSPNISNQCPSSGAKIYRQSDILKNIELLGKDLRNVTEEAKLTERVRNCIKDIEQASDRDQASCLFGEGRTNREENLFLLMTAVESANDALDNVKQPLLKTLRALLGEGSGKDIFQRAQEIEEKIFSPEAIDRSGWNVVNRTSTLNVGGQDFRIEYTSGKGNNCLFYALQPNNHPLPEDCRKVFTQEKIENQLNSLLDGHARNPTPNSRDDITNSLDIMIPLVRANYAIKGLEKVKNIKQLSEVLANHIQRSNCLLDSFIAGAILAREYKQPIVIVTNNTHGTLVSYVLSSDGDYTQESDLSKLNNPKYIYNPVGAHFSRMVAI